MSTTEFSTDFAKDALYDSLYSRVEGEFGGQNAEQEALYRDDLGAYGRECLKLRTRDLRLVNWELNTIQKVLDAVAAKQMAEMGRVRVMSAV